MDTPFEDLSEDKHLISMVQMGKNSISTMKMNSVEFVISIFHLKVFVNNIKRRYHETIATTLVQMRLID